MHLTNPNKREVCAEVKATKKPYKIIREREYKLLTLIHTDLADMSKNTSKIGKIYYILLLL